MTMITVRLAMVTATARMLQTTMTITMPARQLKHKIAVVKSLKVGQKKS